MSSISNSNRSKNTSTRKRRGKKTKTKRVSKELLMKQDSERKMLQLQQQLMFLRWRKCQTGAKMRKILAFIFALTFFTSNSFADITFWTTEVQPARMEKQMEMAKSFEAKTGI